MDSKTAGTPYPFVHELYRAEQLQVLRSILPWIQGGLIIGILGTGAALFFKARVWQLWVLLVVLVVAAGLIILAMYYRHYRRPQPSAVLLISSLLLVALSLPALFNHMIITSAIMSLMIVLTAGTLFSPRFALFISVGLLLLGVSYLVMVRLDPTRGSISYQPLFFSPFIRDVVNLVVFLFSLSFGTRLISINWRSMQRAFTRVVERSWGLEETRNRLADEIHDRQNVENSLWMSRQAYRFLADAAINAADVRELCRKTLQGLVEVWNVDQGVIYLHDQDKGVLSPAAHHGPEREISQGPGEISVDDPQSFVAGAARKKEFLFLSEESQEDLPGQGSAWWSGEPEGMIVLPLLSADKKLLGVIVLLFYHPQKIHTGLRWFFESYIDLTATALENKLSQEKVERQALQLRRSNEFITTLNRVLLQVQGKYVPADILAVLKEEFHKMGLEFLFAVLDGQDRFSIEYLSFEDQLKQALKGSGGGALNNRRFQLDNLPGGLTTSETPLITTGSGPLLQALSSQLKEEGLETFKAVVGIDPDMTMIYLPLRFREELIGFIVVWGEELQDVDAAPLSVFSGQFVAALENARLYNEERKRSQELLRTSNRLEVLREIDLVTIKSKSYQETAALVLSYLGREFPQSHRAVVVFHDREGQAGMDVVTLEEGQLLEHFLQGLEANWIQEAFRRESELSYLPDLRDAEHLSPFQSRVADQGLQAYVSVPLQGEEELIGALFLAWETENPLRQEALDTIQELAYSLSIAVHQHHLREGRRQQNQRIKKSLREKEILLSEIHHRVKNNMQVILSLLRLQSREVQDEATKGVFNELRNRIHSLTLVHDMLYQVDDLSDIQLEAYFDQLTGHILRSYQSDAPRLSVELDIDDLELNVNQIVPCGLLVNELVSNSIKYAFPDRERGTIYVRLKDVEDGVFLEVSDDGVSLPDEISIQESDSLGLKLVQMMTQQLGGRLVVERDRGTKVRIWL